MKTKNTIMESMPLRDLPIDRLESRELSEDESKKPSSCKFGSHRYAFLVDFGVETVEMVVDSTRDISVLTCSELGENW